MKHTESKNIKVMKVEGASWEEVLAGMEKQ